MAVSSAARTKWVKADTWAQELERRRSLATSDDTIRGMLFNGTLEVLQSMGAESLVKRCIEESGETRFLDFFSYPVQKHCQMVSTALPLLVERYGDAEQALRQLGRLAASRFLRVGAGRVMLSLSPRTPRQLLYALPMAYRMAVSFGEYEIRWTGPTSGRLTLKRDFMPHPFHEGVVETSLTLWGAREVQVSGRQTGGLDSECDFCWQ
ncbi:TIGR02265 family protein [Archangium minus]|uniref:TIGR02265 family protein n=1 Tax=Archangium minus TaxID=83450 RepID=A0ABY9X4X3_9BACT|nr:TIGR02265 family protein [Archangium violaceum]WNG50458.1 TIGR02265 family protein [Archangium minus]